MKNNSKGHSWSDLERILTEKGLLTQDEISESLARARIIGELIKARNKHQISQRKLEELTGVRQTTIARIENGNNSPSIDTMLKVLAPLGMTLAVVPIEQAGDF